MARTQLTYQGLLDFVDAARAVPPMPSRMEASPDMFARLKYLFGRPAPGLGAPSGQLLPFQQIPIVVICVLAPMSWRLVAADGSVLQEFRLPSRI